MRTLFAAAVPALLLMAAAAPGQAQTTATPAGKAEAVANGTMDTGARELTPSRDLIGKQVVHRHGGPVAGTIQDVTSGSDGRPVIALKVPNSDRPVMLHASDFERRGDSVVIMHDPAAVDQLARYGQPGVGSGSSTGTAPGTGQ
ncbi:hypothetical protein ACIU1J_12305 [Azospirillum doebereinerae]|uniref:hypothetical protein n=1 Tax=Azospirillum doebereinerae TaxID=92933 RepID=UPI001EE552B3|nr:hypothetical protein [Azospirillum doebereinerae]MCG5242249.1 hypothetical protein [Azospirillum doebereinerae]